MQHFREDIRKLEQIAEGRKFTPGKIFRPGKIKKQDRKFVPGEIVRREPTTFKKGNIVRREVSESNSVENWRREWSSLQGTNYGWINQRRIVIFSESTIEQAVINQIKQGVQDLINQLRLNFSITQGIIDITNLIRVHTLPNEKLNLQSLAQSLTTTEQKSLLGYGGIHACVIVLDRVFEGVNVWGMTEFHNGLMQLALPNIRRRDHNFVRNVAKHEAGHLLGYYLHHDDRKVRGYRETNCNMMVSCASYGTCDKCLDAIRYFWLGLQQRTGIRFFR